MLIEDLGLSKSVYKYLKRAGINYIEELENMTNEELQKIRNIGRVSCYEIRDKIDKYKKNNDDLTDIEHIKFEDAPESWSDRCSGDGYERIINEEGERVFGDNGVSVGIGYRPCAKCGKYPNEDGDDACLGHLGNVMNACCGHGKQEGYIQFDNGITVRGHFKIEKHPCGKTVNDDECCDEDIYRGMDGKWYLKIKTSEWNNWDDCFVEETVQINYCPFCGRKLE